MTSRQVVEAKVKRLFVIAPKTLRNGRTVGRQSEHFYYKGLRRRMEQLDEAGVWDVKLVVELSDGTRLKVAGHTPDIGETTFAVICPKCGCPNWFFFDPRNAAEGKLGYCEQCPTLI